MKPTKSLIPLRLMYLQGQGNYSYLYRQYARFPDVQCYTLLDFEAVLAGFVRIHKSYLVNPAYIDCLSGRAGGATLKLTTGLVLPVSRRRYADLANFLANRR